MRIQHVKTAKGQCEAVVRPRKEVKGKRIGVKGNSVLGQTCTSCHSNQAHSAGYTHHDWALTGCHVAVE